jgi:hypothetical protein
LQMHTIKLKKLTRLCRLKLRVNPQLNEEVPVYHKTKVLKQFQRPVTLKSTTLPEVPKPS